MQFGGAANRTLVRHYQGFTLTELLVVLGILSLIMALVLPAVQASREAARRMQCQSQLRQVMIGLHNYHGAMNVLPPACPGGFDPFLDGKRWGWGTFLLPYIEQQPLYDQLAPTKNALFHIVYDPNKNKLLQTQIGIYLCPSDPSEPLADRNRDFSGPIASRPVASNQRMTAAMHLNHLGFRGATSNLVCNFGAFWRPNYSLWTNDELRGDGVMGCNTALRLSDIQDGTSSTFGIGERTFSNLAAIWAGVETWDQCTAQGIAMVSGTAYYPLNSPASSYPYTCDGVGATGFSSSHPGGANFAFCDGATRFMTNSIESRNQDQLGKSGKLGVYQRLAHANDGLVVEGL